MPRTAARNQSMLRGLPKRVEKAQARAEKVARRTWKSAFDALPPSTRKALKRQSLFRDLPKRVEKVQARVEKVARRTWKSVFDALPPQARKALKRAATRVETEATKLDRRRERALERVEKQGRELFANVESRAASAAKPLVHRLDVASRRDVERLHKRLTQLERKLSQREKHKAAA